MGIIAASSTVPQEEQVGITAPFLAVGLERDERCVYVGNAEPVDVIRQGLKTAGVCVDKETAKNRLILTSDEDYLDGGHWKTEKMLGFLQIAYDSDLYGSSSQGRKPQG